MFFNFLKLEIEIIQTDKIIVTRANRIFCILRYSIWKIRIKQDAKLLKLFRDRNIFARTIYVRIIEMERYRYSALSIQLINKRALFDHLVLEHGQRADLWVTLLEAGRAVLYLIRHFTRSEHYPLRNALSPKAWINHCIPYARMYLTHVKSLYSWVHARTIFFFS